ncbi:MAG: ATP synthase F1 subunit delta [Chloroflexi bacterium]|nr:ATP synthase F1 subunit delta [Chloroflexota bacterium]
MAVAASAKRYAQAVFTLAQEGNTFDQWLSDLQTLGELGQDQGFRLIMESPRVPLARKQALLRERLPNLSPLAMNLAQLLVAKGRVELIPGLVEEVRRLVDERRGIAHARVLTAVPLEPPEQTALSQQLARYTGRQVVLTAEVDPSIVGGVVARIGDKLLDGSTRGRLEALRRQLAARR